MKLLRVLQNGEFERLGSSTTRRADVRVVSATNADLRQAIAKGEFREDLFFRLNVIEIRVPPLCERAEDILPLAEHFLRIHAEQQGTPLSFSAQARAALEAYDWPGNVSRARKSGAARSAGVSQRLISAADLDLVNTARETASEAPTKGGAQPELDPLAAAERRVVEDALARAQGVVSRAAAELGLSRQALYRRMERLGIEMERRTEGLSARKRLEPRDGRSFGLTWVRRSADSDSETATPPPPP